MTDSANAETLPRKLGRAVSALAKGARRVLLVRAPEARYQGVWERIGRRSDRWRRVANEEEAGVAGIDRVVALPCSAVRGLVDSAMRTFAAGYRAR